MTTIRTNYFRFLILGLFMTLSLSLGAASRLFHISRSVNKNIVCYDVQMKNGALDLEKPIHVYWHNNEDRPGAEDELSAIQRKMAYGYKVKTTGTNEATVVLTAYGKRTIKVCKRSGKWVALININGKECYLSEIYVKCKGPMSVEYVELRGKAVNGGSKQIEKVKA